MAVLDRFAAEERNIHEDASQRGVFRRPRWIPRPFDLVIRFPALTHRRSAEQHRQEVGSRECLGVGASELAIILLIVGMYVAIGAAVVAVAVRILGRRKDPQRVLRERLQRREITPAEFDDALRILGER